MKVTVDEERCAGHGMCLTLCPEVFDMTDDGWAVADPEEVPAGLEALPRTPSRTARTSHRRNRRLTKEIRMPKGYVIHHRRRQRSGRDGRIRAGRPARRWQARRSCRSTRTPSRSRAIGTAPRPSLLEFESPDAAREWYNSDAYQEAAKLRQARPNATAPSPPHPAPRCCSSSESAGPVRPAWSSRARVARRVRAACSGTVSAMCRSSAARRRACASTVSASQRGIERSCRHLMKLRGRSAAQKFGTDTAVTLVSPNRSGPSRSNAPFARSLRRNRGRSTSTPRRSRRTSLRRRRRTSSSPTSLRRLRRIRRPGRRLRRASPLLRDTYALRVAARRRDRRCG